MESRFWVDQGQIGKMKRSNMNDFDLMILITLQLIEKRVLFENCFKGHFRNYYDFPLKGQTDTKIKL